MNIETARMRLRPISIDDAPALHRLDSDPVVMRFVSGGQPTSRHQIEQWVIPRAIADMSSRSGSGTWIADDPRDGRFLGWFSLRAPRHSRVHELELTYRLHRFAWGHGLGTEGSRALVHHAFTRTGTIRVFAGAMAVNVASRRVMEKSGMRLVALHQGDLSIAGSERGDVEYEYRRCDWLADRSRDEGALSSPISAELTTVDPVSWCTTVRAG